jgi:hypothetical protein
MTIKLTISFFVAEHAFTLCSLEMMPDAFGCEILGAITLIDVFSKSFSGYNHPHSLYSDQCTCDSLQAFVRARFGRAGFRFQVYLLPRRERCLGYLDHLIRRGYSHEQKNNAWLLRGQNVLEIIFPSLSLLAVRVSD